jgi:hypothetical protein
MTGGTAAVALGGAYVIWSLLDGNKQRNQGVLEELETKIYTLAATPNPESLAGLIVSKIKNEYQTAEIFTAPQLPLNLLANAYKSWLKPDEIETVIALIDTSFFDDGKEGIAFTDKRIVWKETWGDSDYLSYRDLSKRLENQGLEVIGNEEYRKNSEKLRTIASLFINESDQNQFITFIQQLAKGYLALASQKLVA